MNKKKDVGMGLFVQCFYALSLHLVSVAFGTAIPTSLYIFGKCFIYFSSHIAVLVWRYSGMDVCWNGVCNTCFMNGLSHMLYVSVRDVHLQCHYICIEWVDLTDDSIIQRTC